MRALALLLALALAACDGAPTTPDAGAPAMTIASGGGVTLSIPDTLWSGATNIMAPPYVVFPACDLPLNYGGAEGHFVSGRVRYSPFPLPLGFAVLWDVQLDSATLDASLGAIPASGQGGGVLPGVDVPSPYAPGYTADVLLRWRTTTGLDSARVFSRCLRETYGDPVEGGEEVEW